MAMLVVWFEKLYLKSWQSLHLCGSIQQKKPLRVQDQQHKPISYTRKRSSGGEMKWSHFAVQVWDANGYFTAVRTVWTEPESPNY